MLALLIFFLLPLPTPQPYSRQESQQDIVLGGDMPISSIQATIAKLSIRPPSLTEPDAEPAFSGEEATFAVVPDLGLLGEHQSPQHLTEAPPSPLLSQPLTSPTHCASPPNGLDAAAASSPSSDTPPVSAVPSASPPPVLSSLELLASLTPEAFSMEGAGGGRGKQRVTKQSFLQAAEGQGLQGSRAEEGDDPLCSLDPLWTLNKN